MFCCGYFCIFLVCTYFILFVHFQGGIINNMINLGKVSVTPAVRLQFLKNWHPNLPLPIICSCVRNKRYEYFVSVNLIYLLIHCILTTHEYYYAIMLFPHVHPPPPTHRPLILIRTIVSFGSSLSVSPRTDINMGAIVTVSEKLQVILTLNPHMFFVSSFFIF